MEVGTVLREMRSAAPPRAVDVMREAEERNWFRRYAHGQYIYLPPWVRLARCFQESIRRRAIERLGFEEWLFPRMVPQPALESFHLTQFAPDLLVQADAAGTYFLDPVQCVSIYQFLRGHEINREKLPLKIVECMGGWTWRNEKEAEMDGPFRAREFLRVEHVYFGSPAEVVRIRREVQDGLLELLKGWAISFQVVVGKGCMNLPYIEARQLAATNADDVPVHDIEVPIRGALRADPERESLKGSRHICLTDGAARERENDAFYLDSDEICGCSSEGDHLVASFNIRASDGLPVWSGCTGIGINRLVLAFLYQHGFDEARWPALEGYRQAAA
ncbi:MAG: hypothetical protein E6G97_20790 [Alphaproteobacteria bacterium]|nr:MAG: hypothetical protein E6G97_20790 [Alphaproteobacteria bacterium]